jgi:hypothetical protein
MRAPDIAGYRQPKLAGSRQETVLLEESETNVSRNTPPLRFGVLAADVSDSILLMCRLAISRPGCSEPIHRPSTSRPPARRALFLKRTEWMPPLSQEETSRPCCRQETYDPQFERSDRPSVSPNFSILQYIYGLLLQHPRVLLRSDRREIARVQCTRPRVAPCAAFHALLAAESTIGGLLA